MQKQVWRWNLLCYRTLWWRMLRVIFLTETLNLRAALDLSRTVRFKVDRVKAQNLTLTLNYDLQSQASQDRDLWECRKLSSKVSRFKRWVETNGQTDGRYRSHYTFPANEVGVKASSLFEGRKYNRHRHCANSAAPRSSQCRERSTNTGCRRWDLAGRRRQLFTTSRQTDRHRQHSADIKSRAGAHSPRRRTESSLDHTWLQPLQPRHAFTPRQQRRFTRPRWWTSVT